MFGAPPESDFNFDENLINTMNEYSQRVQKLIGHLGQNKKFEILSKTEI